MDLFSFFFWRFYYFFRDPKRKIPLGPVVVAPADGKIVYVTDVNAGTAPCPVKDGTRVPLEEWAGLISFVNDNTQSHSPTSEKTANDDISRGKEKVKKYDGEGTLIGIYMSPMSVHYNRAPISGRVSFLINRPAREKNLTMVKTFIRLIWNMLPYEKGSSFIINNARNTVIIDGEVSVMVIRIADKWVNNIDCFIFEGDYVEKGMKIGLIRMGSQCDLFIPKNANIKVLCKPGDKVFAGETVLGTY